jgi:hypothetical protein
MSIASEEIIGCPHCLVCSITNTDFNEEGIAVCPVCGREVKANE